MLDFFSYSLIVSVTLFPCDGLAYVYTCSALHEKNTDEFATIKTSRKVTIQYAMEYIQKHNLVGESCGSYLFFYRVKNRLYK